MDTNSVYLHASAESVDFDADILISALFIGRPTLRSYSIICECWHESVQIHIPRYCRPVVRFRSIEARSQLSKGQHAAQDRRPTAKGYSVSVQEASIT